MTTRSPVPTPDDVTRLLSQVARPFRSVEHARLGALLERIGDARVVLLGEATHGTSEFYRMRARISRALIEEKGFRVVAVEADWPDAERIDRWVRDRQEPPSSARSAFLGFPSWMWRNREVLDFVAWLRAHNASASDHSVQFRGLDLYSLHHSIAAVLRHLERIDPALARSARERYDCFEPFRADPERYGSAVITDQFRGCEEEATNVLRDVLRRRMEDAAADDEALLDAEQNARVIANAEQYYRSMYYAGPESWNLRDHHMFETLQALLSQSEPDTRAIVWAHNSHVGDARATEMSDRGETNLGALVREHFGEAAYLIGFGTNTGTVAAARHWGGPMERMNLRPALPGSYEHLCHASGVPSFFLPLRYPDHRSVRAHLLDPRLQRAVGVVYRAETERQSHYFSASLPTQFDEYVWIDETTSVEPLGPSHAPDLPERHPFLLAD